MNPCSGGNIKSFIVVMKMIWCLWTCIIPSTGLRRNLSRDTSTLELDSKDFTPFEIKPSLKESGLTNTNDWYYVFYRQPVESVDTNGVVSWSFYYPHEILDTKKKMK